MQIKHAGFRSESCGGGGLFKVIKAFPSMSTTTRNYAMTLTDNVMFPLCGTWEFSETPWLEPPNQIVMA